MNLSRIMFDREIACPHCGVKNLKEGIPLVDFKRDGYVYQCEDCKEFCKIGMLIEPAVTKLQDF